MQATMVHFLRPYELFAECAPFKCHKNCKIIILKKIIIGLRLPTWIRIFIKGWNSMDIHQSYSNGLLKRTYGL
jgi:hypothetical protein